MTKAATIGSVMAVDNAAAATGAIVFWKLGEDPIDKDTLEGDWQLAGLDPKDAPHGATPAKALRRAMREQTGRHTLNRRVGRGAFALVDERGANHVDADPEYGVRARASLERVDGTVQLAIKTDDHGAAARVRAAFDRNLDVVAARDVSWWLSSRFMDAVQAVALRDAGGVYFLPGKHLARYRQVGAILKRMAGHTLYEVPAVRTDEAVGAILDALAGETRAALDGLTAELAEGDLGGRALRSRKTLCEDIGAKLATYEGVLGRGLEELRESLRLVEANVAAAALAAVAAADMEAAS